ncbi:MAG: nitroreductase family deazaflavin-dependent oxidoreductase [Candidatus Limnocylindrales bacterium]
MTLPPDAASQPYVWLTTTGRRTGLDRTVELWFALEGETVHFLAGGGPSSHWVQNSIADPAVRLRVGAADFLGRARVPESESEEEHAARRALAAKYQGWSEGQPLSGWARRSFCLAVDLAEAA